MKITRTFIVVLALVLLVLLGSTLTLYFDWPRWALVIFPIAVVVAVVLILFVGRRLGSWLKRCTLAWRRTVELIAAHRTAPITRLVENWQSSVRTLRRSALRQRGDPLYVLPWYMVIGRSGEGKTTALTSARLSSSIGDGISKNAAVRQTENCDWWYFNRSVVIDCAGRYFGADGYEADRKEWDVLLKLLARYRSREGLNGLVLVVSAERLINASPEARVQDGQVIRARIEQLMRQFGKRFPIYVLVTKCDQLYGFEAWSQLLPKNALTQAMGYLGVDAQEQKDTEFIDNAFESVMARLRVLRISLVAQYPAAAAQLLLFPNELQNTRVAMHEFIRACLGESPYLEAPFLRGLFFSSGLQAGGAHSTVLSDDLASLPAHEPAMSGAFLRDLFDRILPDDRDLLRPAANYNRWRLALRSRSLRAWLVVAAILAAMMTVSFAWDIGTMNRVRQGYPFNAMYEGHIEKDVGTLGKANSALLEMAERNADWRSRGLPFDQVDRLQTQLRTAFLNDYVRYVQPATRVTYVGGSSDQTDSETESSLSRYILNKTRTINLLKMREQGAHRRQLADMPQPVYLGAALYGEDLNEQINRLQVSYLAWSPTGANVLRQQIASEQADLETMLYSGSPLHWIPRLAALDGKLRPVAVSDFWLQPGRAAALRSQYSSMAGNSTTYLTDRGGSDPGTGTADSSTGTTGPNGLYPGVIRERLANSEQARRSSVSSVVVPAGYTRVGKFVIEQYLSEVRVAVDSDARFVAWQAQFEEIYSSRRLEVWRSFVEHFPDGEDLMGGEAAWRDMLTGVTGKDSPYLRALDVLNQEFGDVPDARLPHWLLVSRRIGKIRNESASSYAAGRVGKMVGVVNAFGGDAIRHSFWGDAVQAAQNLRGDVRAVDVLSQYFEAVRQIAAASVTGAGKAYEVTAAFYGYGADPAIKVSVVHDAAHALAQLRGTFDTPEADDAAVWRLLAGPLHASLAYALQQTSCALQAEWEAKVYWPLKGASSTKEMLDSLYGPQGSVWGFVGGSAKPFLHVGANQINAAQTAGYTVPFDEKFLPTLNSAFGKRINQIMLAQRATAEAEQQQVRTQSMLEQQRQQQASAEQALGDIAQKVATLRTQTYPLKITAQPVNANEGARARPYSTVLTVQCASGSHTLSNFNFPVSTSFNWIPNQCGDVNLAIHVDNIVLNKKYSGSQGMVSFLQDFRDGAHTFVPEDFAEASSTLADLNVTGIVVRYELDGADRILDDDQRLGQLQSDKAQQTQLRQQAADAIARQNALTLQPGITSAIAPAPMQIALPQRIAACWKPDAAPVNQVTRQQLSDALMDAHGVLLNTTPSTAPVAASPTISQAVSVPPLPSLPGLTDR